MTTKLYLDTRATGKGKPAPVKIAICSHGKTAYISTGVSVLPQYWDKYRQLIITHPQKSQLNNILSRKKITADSALLALQESGELHGASVQKIRDSVVEKLEPERHDTKELLIPALVRYMDSKTRHGTVAAYALTIKKIRDFDKKADSLHFHDITPEWLRKFEAYLSGTTYKSANARSILFRNIRTVFNRAIDEGVTDYYPFRTFKIKHEQTKSRALTAEQLRTFFDIPCEPSVDAYRDIFKLSFLLCGMNICDLANAKKTDIVNGRLEFRRLKTGQLVSAPICSMACEIIERHKGKGEYLLNISDRYKNTRDYLHRLDNNLKKVGKTYNPHTKTWFGEPYLPNISSYYARYSFASIAAENGISEDSIARCLGHAKKGVTSIYIRINGTKLIDATCRAVFDAVFR